MRLFTKTWVNDYPWNKISIASVVTHLGADEKGKLPDVDWHVVVDDGQRSEFQKVIDQVKQELKYHGPFPEFHIHEMSEKWPEAIQIPRGYHQQQWIKMNAHRVMGNGPFWNWDSDLIAQRYFRPSDLQNGAGKNIYWITPFNALMGQGCPPSDLAAHTARKKTMKHVIGFSPSFEYMRCLPIAGEGEILRVASETDEWRRAYELFRQANEGVSEFNYIGFFSHLYFPDSYDWRNTQNYKISWKGEWGQENCYFYQCWSWGGVPDNLYKHFFQ